MKPKLQLGGEKEGGNTSARSSAQTMQHSPVAAFGNEAIVRSIVPPIYRFPGVLFNVHIRVLHVPVITLQATSLSIPLGEVADLIQVIIGLTHTPVADFVDVQGVA